MGFGCSRPSRTRSPPKHSKERPRHDAEADVPRCGRPSGAQVDRLRAARRPWLRDRRPGGRRPRCDARDGGLAGGRGSAGPEGLATRRSRPRARRGARRRLVCRRSDRTVDWAPRHVDGARARRPPPPRRRAPPRGDRPPARHRLRDRAHASAEGVLAPRRSHAHAGSRDSAPAGALRMTVERLPVLEVASLSGEVDDVMRGIVDRLAALPGADGASLSTLDGDTAFFRVCAGADAPLEGRTFALADTLGAECVGRGNLTVFRRTTGLDVDRCLTPGAAAIVLAPVEWGGRTRGILGVRSTDENSFDENGVEKIRMLAAGASIALRNAEVVEALAASERNYRQLHDRAADAVLVTHRSDTIVDANAAAASLLGYSVEELRAMKVSEMFSTAELTALPLRDDELMQRGELRSERPFLRKDGSEVMVEYSCRVIGDGRVHTTLRDVTERRRNEERLRTNLGRLHAIVQTQQEISSLELDKEAVTTTLVQRAQRLAGGDGAAVQWFVDDDCVFANCSGIAAPHVGMRLERAGSLAGLAALVGEALYAPDAADDPRVNRDATARLGVRSLVCAPLYHDGQVQGTLSVLSRRPQAF